MREKQENTRIRATQEAIKQAYLRSLQSSDKINVAELCRRARVNRGTFYNHFADIADVQETLENELFESVASELKKSSAFSYEFFLNVLRVIKENTVLVKAVLDNIQNSVFSATSFPISAICTSAILSAFPPPCRGRRRRACSLTSCPARSGSFPIGCAHSKPSPKKKSPKRSAA